MRLLERLLNIDESRYTPDELGDGTCETGWPWWAMVLAVAAAMALGEWLH